MRPLLLIAFLPLFFPFSVSADYYRYFDKNGVPHYVDTVRKVPKVYHDHVIYLITPESTSEDADLKKPVSVVLEKKIELGAEYGTLMKEREELLESFRKWEEKFKAWEIKKTARHKN
jgi:hypothetical protein